jgi:hypothetical protein
MTNSDFNYLLSSIKGLSPEQLRRLRQRLDRQLAQPKKPTDPAPGKSAKRAKPVASKKKPLTTDEFNQRLFAAGRIASLPDPALDIDDDDPDDAPVPIKGEPLSETIIRERRCDGDRLAILMAHFVSPTTLVEPRRVRALGCPSSLRLALS